MADAKDQYQYAPNGLVVIEVLCFKLPEPKSMKVVFEFGLEFFISGFIQMWAKANSLT